MDKPNEVFIRLARAFKDLGWRVVVITGRVEAMRDCTIGELCQFGIPFDEVIMRGNGDFRKSGEYKRDVVRGLGGFYGRVIAYDDDPSVVSTLKGLGVVVVPASLFALQKYLASNQPAWLNLTSEPSSTMTSRAL